MKNTRLIYTDEEHVKMYEAIPDKQFKEYIMAMIKYQYGDDDFADTIQDPMVKALFLAEKSRIDFNEEKWRKRAKASSENGKNGGRPPKDKQKEPVIEVSEFNQDFSNPIDLTITKEDLEDGPYTKEDWISDIENGLDDGSYQAVFDNWWGMFFTRRSDALSFVYSRVPRVGGRYTNLT